tara:strand:- start:147 stop:272 length:126 start_codon:yes stop_codon:yes gene_type:complete
VVEVVELVDHQIQQEVVDPEDLEVVVMVVLDKVEEVVILLE